MLNSVLALIGMVTIHSNSLPYIVEALKGNVPTTPLPSIMLVVGLLLLQPYTKDKLYKMANWYGIISNIIVVNLYYWSI